MSQATPQRYAKIDIDGREDGETILFCPTCDWQSALPKGQKATSEKCDKCGIELLFVIIDATFRKFQKNVRGSAKPQSMDQHLDAVGKELMHEYIQSLRERTKAIPQHINDEITSQVRKFAKHTGEFVDMQSPGFEARAAQLAFRVTDACLGVVEYLLKRADSKAKANEKKLILPS